MKKLFFLLNLFCICSSLVSQNLSVVPSQLEVLLEPNAIENQTVTLTNSSSLTMNWETEIIDLMGSFPGDMFDLIMQQPLEESNYESGITTDGEFIYTSNQGNGTIRKYDMNGQFLGSFNFPSIGGFRGICWDGTYFYGSTGMTFIYVLDFETQTLVSTFDIFNSVTAITFDEDNDVFYGYNWQEGKILIFDHSGAQLGVFLVEPDPFIFSGLAYDNLSPGGPYLWGYGALNSELYMITQYQMPNFWPTGTTINLEDYLIYPANGLAGGLFVTPNIQQGVIALGGLVKHNWIWAVEIGEYYDWLSVNPSSGTLDPGSSSYITATFDASDVLPWYYEAEINFAGQPGNDTATVLAAMGIEGQPGMYWLEVEQNCSNALLTWETIPPGAATDSIHIYRDEEYYATAFTQPWEDSLLIPGETHSYFTTGYFFNGWESNATDTEAITITEPDNLVPVNLTFNPTSADSIVCLSWENQSCLEPDIYGVCKDLLVLDFIEDTCYCDTLTFPGTFYYYIFSDFYFGTYWSETMEYQWLGTGTKDLQSSRFTIYPNPARDFVIISTEKSIESIIFTNLQGTKVMEVQKPQTQKIDVSNLEQGIYLVEVKSKNKSVTAKIVIN